MGVYEREKPRQKEVALSKITLSQVPSSQPARDAGPPWAGSELTRMPTRPPSHQSPRPPPATPGDPAADGVWRACYCPWPHSAVRLFSASIQALASQLLASGAGGLPWQPSSMDSQRCSLHPPSLPLLTAGGERDSPLNISRPSRIGCSAPAAGCGDRQHLGVCGVRRLRGTTFCVSLELSALISISWCLHQTPPPQVSCLFPVSLGFSPSSVTC